MLSDAAEWERTTDLEADVCIVGAGAAGITLAPLLADAGLAVVLVEGGHFGFEEQIQALYRGENVGHPYFPLDACRLRMFGGTTNHWVGYCRPLDPIDFEERSWIPHSGWPFGPAELEPYYREASRLCELRPEAWDAGFWQEASGRAGLPLESAALVDGVFQRSPPTRFGFAYRDRVVESDAIHTVLHANVVRIETHPQGDRVRQVEVRAPGGRRGSVTARAFVLAAGGIENPRLLLASRSRMHPEGIGNQHDLVGRFFTEHPHLVDGFFLPSDPELAAGYYGHHVTDAGGFEGLLTASEETLRSEQLQNLSITLAPTARRSASALEAENSAGVVHLKLLANRLSEGELPDDLVDKLGRVLLDLDDVAVAAWSRATGSREEGRMFKVFVRSEQAPNPESRLTLGDDTDAFGLPRPRLAWRLSDGDLRTVRRAHELLGREVGRAGLGRVFFPEGDGRETWGRRIFGGNHHMGTTRMHVDPEQGVVDPDGRVHGIENLYVAGSSVFPTCGYANPTLTLVALAARLGAHLGGALS